MQNLKIKVNNEAESREAQELFFELGYEWANCGKTYNNMVVFGDYIFLTNSKTLNYGLGLGKNEIPIAELRDMVKPMQEYLNKETYEYKLAHTKPDGEWISIPDGENVAYKDPDDGSIYFTRLEMGYRDVLVIWQRPTQPEALPFIDDEPQSLNDQYAEIEQVRQAVKVKSGSDSDHAADAMSYGFMGIEQPQSIEATLAERQSTYGNFEDVAFVTENIMSVLGSVRVNGLSELPVTHRMALYMIASKMARIVNGDFNHIDGWHDIGGYAKLVEDLIVENNI